MNAPVFRTQLGLVKGAVFQQQSDNGTIWYSTKITSSYKDNQGNWQDGSSFNTDQLASVEKVAERCRNWVMSATENSLNGQ